VLDVARSLGAETVRLAVPGYDRTRSYASLLEAEREYLTRMEGLCLKYGVKGLLETHHGTIAASASAAYRLCEGFDPAAIGVLYDPGNMVFEGFENYRMGLELLGPYLAHVHVKNGGWAPEAGTDLEGVTAWKGSWRKMRHGMVPWRQVVEDLRAVGYDGYLGLEDFSGEFSSREMLKQFADDFGKLL
jgi:sugar phosphate isomerase/epimerase